MYANLYHHPRQLAAAQSAETIVAGLFAAYRADPAAMPGDWPARLPANEPERSRHIADFIAGMTDRWLNACGCSPPSMRPRSPPSISRIRPEASSGSMRWPPWQWD
jgi:hypothetical protein